MTDHTIAKELVALRAALKLAKRRGIWKGDPAEVLPVGFAPEYKPRNRFLTYDELEALLGELLEDAAARVAFTIATSAEAAATERALREDVSPDRLSVQVRGSKRATRWRKVPIVANWQRELLDFALEHARGRDGRLFCRRPSSVRRWSAPARAPASRAARRTISAARTPPGCARMASPTSSARRRWATRIRACSIASMRDYRRSCFASVPIGQQVDDVTAGKLAPRSGRRSNLEIQPEVRHFTNRSFLALRRTLPALFR